MPDIQDYKYNLIRSYNNIICNIAYIIKKHETLTTIPTIHVYINRANNRLMFKTRYRHKLELKCLKQ